MNKQNFKTLVVLTALVLVGFFLGSRQSQLVEFWRWPWVGLGVTAADSLSAGRLKSMLTKKNFALINVHVPYEREIEKTDTFIPFDQIVANSASLPKDKNAPIVLYCKTGRMSAEALQTLRKLGYTNVKHLSGGMDAWEKAGGKLIDLSALENQVLPQAGYDLPIAWGDLGPQLVKLGVIDLAKFKQVVKVTAEQEKILTQGTDQKIHIDKANSQFVVDMLWALGLAQKSLVYTEGPMGKEYKKDAGNFASTGGWTLSRGAAMNYLNRYELIKLTPEQERRVGEIAKNVYRPCCGNSTWFPDCNHGMAALAAIELMVAAGGDEATIYRNVLALNSFWFPDNYLYVATYFARQGIGWDKVDPKTILGQDYSSAQGANAVAQKVGPLPYKPQENAGACGA